MTTAAAATLAFIEQVGALPGSNRGAAEHDALALLAATIWADGILAGDEHVIDAGLRRSGWTPDEPNPLGTPTRLLRTLRVEDAIDGGRRTHVWAARALELVEAAGHLDDALCHAETEAIDTFRAMLASLGCVDVPSSARTREVLAAFEGTDAVLADIVEAAAAGADPIVGVAAGSGAGISTLARHGGHVLETVGRSGHVVELDAATLADAAHGPGSLEAHLRAAAGGVLAITNARALRDPRLSQSAHTLAVTARASRRASLILVTDTGDQLEGLVGESPDLDAGIRHRLALPTLDTGDVVEVFRAIAATFGYRVAATDEQIAQAAMAYRDEPGRWAARHLFDAAATAHTARHVFTDDAAPAAGDPNELTAHDLAAATGA